MAPIRIQAQALRRRSAALADAFGPFAILPETGGMRDDDAASQKQPWRQSDVKRAIDTAAAASLPSYRVEIAPNGTISVIVGDPAETAPDSDPGHNLFR